MLDPKNINDIIQDIIETLPPGLKNMPSDMQNNLKITLRNMFERLDLVTREEFEVQRKVLLRTREKVDLLERKLSELEK